MNPEMTPDLKSNNHPVSYAAYMAFVLEEAEFDPQLWSGIVTLVARRHLARRGVSTPLPFQIRQAEDSILTWMLEFDRRFSDTYRKELSDE